MDTLGCCVQRRRFIPSVFHQTELSPFVGKSERGRLSSLRAVSTPEKHLLFMYAVGARVYLLHTSARCFRRTSAPSGALVLNFPSVAAVACICTDCT